MPLTFTFNSGFVDCMIALPKSIHPKFAKCLQKLSRNREHPGLNVEKMHGRARGLLSARVDIGYRLIFEEVPGFGIELMFVGKEEEAYRQAERMTAMKSVSFCLPLRETVKEEDVPAIHVGVSFPEVMKILATARKRGALIMRQTKHAEKIREFANTEYIQPARKRKETSVAIRAGDVAKVLNLQDRIAAVCSALGAKAFQEEYNVKLIATTGPHTSTTTEFTFEI